MTRQFSIPTVLRMVPNGLLQAFFESLGHEEFDPCWPELKEREIDPLLKYLGDLPSHQSNEIESALRSIFELSCESGFAAILEAGSRCGHDELSTLVPEELGLYGKAMWSWLQCRDAFDKAQQIHQIEHLSWWRKRNDLPNNEPDSGPESIAHLDREISTLLNRGKACTVETLQRDDVSYFFAHPDDFVQNTIIHDADEQLAPIAFRQTLLVVFAYHRKEGSLEMFARLPKHQKEQLEVLFAETILHWELGPHEPDAAYELNQLKEASFDLELDPADGLRVHIRKMRLSAKQSGHRILVEIDAADPNDNIHKAIRKCVNLEEIPLPEWNATQVTFCFEFLPRDDRKPGKHSFDVTYPRSCSLRSARPERVELIQKYLKRWQIDLAESPEPSPVAVGT